MITDFNHRLIKSVCRCTDDSFNRISSYFCRDSCIRNCTAFMDHFTKIMSSHSFHYYVAVFSSGKSRSDPNYKFSSVYRCSQIFFCQYCIYNYICLILFQILKSWIHKNRYIPFFYSVIYLFRSVSQFRSNMFYFCISFIHCSGKCNCPSYSQWNFRLCHNNFKSAFI